MTDLCGPVHLPHRCHYTPTVEYLHGPPHTLHTMPSMIQSWIFGCSEGPSRMFRRSQLDVWKVPVGCLEVPDVWKFQLDVQILDCHLMYI